MKKILYFCDFDPSIPGGAQESMKAIISGLNKDFQFIMVVPQTSLKTDEYQQIILNYKNFNIKELNFKNKIKLCNDFYKVIKTIKPDLVHVQMTSSMFLVSTLKKLYLIPKVPIIYTERGVLDKYGKKMFLCIKLFSNLWSKIVTTTEYSKSLYTNLLSIPSKKIDVISNTAGEKFVEFNEYMREELRKKYDINQNEIVVMFNGRMNRDKNWELASDIIIYLVKEYNAKIMLVLGSDKTESNRVECDEYITKLKKKISENQLLYFQDLKLQELEKLYYISDIFILTSKVESFGRTAIEAMSRKNIVFGTNVDGLREVINFEDYLYTDYNDFCVKFSKFYLDKKLNSENKNMFYSRYQNNFSFEKNINKYKEIYKEILAK